jgi:glutathione S-transferase
MQIRVNAASPFARKVRIVVRETGLTDRIEEIQTVVSPVTPNIDLAGQNPLIKIPALTLADGTALYDSRVICEYLDTLAGTTLFPRSGPERWRAVCQQALCDGILDAAVTTRYEVAVRPEPLRWSKWIDGQRSKIEGGLAALAKAQPQFGAHFDIGQIGAACVLGYLDFRFPEMDWRSRHPGLTTWFEGASKRASVRDTFPVA